MLYICHSFIDLKIKHKKVSLKLNLVFQFDLSKLRLSNYSLMLNIDLKYNLYFK